MRDFDESLARLAADALGGRIRRDQLGMRGFQRLQLPHHRVVFGVGDLGRVQHVIQMLVVAQFLAQGLNFVGDAQNGDSLQFRRIRLRGSVSVNRNWLAVPILLLTLLTYHV